MGGLILELQYDVRSLEPKSLQDVIWLAYVFDEKARAKKPLSRPSSSCYFPTSSKSNLPWSPQAAPPIQSPNTKCKPTSTTTTPQSSTFRRLTQAETNERRERGLCFNCDEQFCLSHTCKKPFIAMLKISHLTKTQSNSTIAFRMKTHLPILNLQ